jgi:hypothetical protein
MAKVAGKDMASLIFLIVCCSITQLSSAFVIQSSKISGTNKAIPGLNTVLAATVVRDEVAVDTSLNDVLEALDKRLTVGSLSDAETKDFMQASDALLEGLKSVGSAPKDIPQVESSLKDLPEVEGPKDLLEYEDHELRSAVMKFDVDAVTSMLEAGMEMDDVTVETAFWEVVSAVDRAEAEDKPLSADVAVMLHHVFDADMKLLLQREQIRTNITCMQPDESGGLAGAARRMNSIFDDGDSKNIPLTEGRKCEGGDCCDKCSRNIFPTFALDHESNFDVFPGISSLTFNDLEKVATSTIIQFVRLIERVRRTIAHEYGLPLKNVLPLQAYSRKYVAGTTQQGGGGGEGDFVILHTDESTHTGYHYSCVVYLSTQGVDFEGGNFVFNDPETDPEKIKLEMKDADDDDDIDISVLEALKNGELPDAPLLSVEEEKTAEYYASLEDEIRKAGRKLTPFHPTRGSAVIFSSGWENMHEVEKITSGTRYAVPCFFTTCPVPDAAYDQMNVGKPKTNEDIADDWLHLLLAHRQESPLEAVGRVKELLMKWHVMCTPLSEH